MSLTYNGKPIKLKGLPVEPGELRRGKEYVLVPDGDGFRLEPKKEEDLEDAD